MIARGGASALLAAGSVLCGAAVGLVTNLITGRWSIGLGVGLVGLVLCWMSLEVARSRQAAKEPAAADVNVEQQTKTASGRVIGARTGKTDRSFTIRQCVDDVTSTGEVIGYDGSTDGRTRNPDAGE